MRNIRQIVTYLMILIMTFTSSSVVKAEELNTVTASELVETIDLDSEEVIEEKMESDDMVLISGTEAVGVNLNVASTVADEKMPVFTVEDAISRPGKEVKVDITVENNAQIIAAQLKVIYDEKLTLIDAENGDAFSYLTLQKPGVFKSPSIFSWDGESVPTEGVKDGIVLTLTFKVSESVEVGSTLGIKIEAEDDNFRNNDMLELSVKTKDNNILALGYTPGDVNDDDKIDVADVILTRRYIVGGYDVEIVSEAADVNNDLNVNAADVTLMRRYIAGGYNVKLKPSIAVQCTHEKVKFDAVKATCVKSGNIEYYYCAECDRYYKDANGKKNVGVDDIEIEATGHTIVIDPAVDATDTSLGLTEGSHCSVCNEIIVAQEEVAADCYRIKYDLANGDSYLGKAIIVTSEDALEKNDYSNQVVIVNNNPKIVLKGGSTKTLEDPVTPGYTFNGWYDASEGGNRIYKIENADHNITLYAHWSKRTYKIQFQSDLIEHEDMTYTTDEGRVLPVLELGGYIFAGWSDDSGKIIKKIKPGESGNKQLYANWISNRNQAWAKRKLGEPIILEQDNQILFAYEIGEIRNVPINVLHDFGYINSIGVHHSATVTHSSTATISQIEAYAKAAEKATVENATITLSKDWTESTEVTQKYCEENGIDYTETNENSVSNTGETYISRSNGGSSSTSNVDTEDEYNLETSVHKESHEEGENHSGNESHSYEKETKDTIAAKLGAEIEVGASASALGIGASKRVKIDGSFEKSDETGETNNWTEANGWGSNSSNGNEDSNENQTGTIKHHTSESTNTSNWNTESGYKQSATTSQSQKISTNLSKKISQETGIGQSYTKNQGESSTQGLTSSASNKEEYSSSVTYSTAITETVTETIDTNSAKTGYHRWVMASTAHVFGVVGYDIATGNYYTYTYSMMDDDAFRYEDYSYKTSSYDDNQNSVINFEIPYEINDYIKARVFATDGLEIDVDGTVTGYTGSDSYVVIPDYFSVTNKDNGNNNVIKVTGISSKAFAGNTNITGVELSSYISEVPDNAFKGCNKLRKLYAPGLKKIGTQAFAGTDIRNWSIGSGTISLGELAFKGSDSLTISVANKSVVLNAIDSGVKNITIDMEKMVGDLNNTDLKISDDIEGFTLNGYGKSFKEFSLMSEAKKTVVNRVDIENTSKIPLKISSSEVGLYQMSVSATGTCLILNGAATELDLYGRVNMISGGDAAILGRNVAMTRKTSGLATSLNVTGNWYCCKTPTGMEWIKLDTGSSIRLVDQDNFDARCGACMLIFDAGEGNCTTQTKVLDNGGVYGTLPVPTREYYTFVGWYDENGQKATENTRVTGESVVLTAHYTKNNVSDWVLATQVPANASIEESKWTYTKTEWGTTDSGTGASSISGSGWTLDPSQTKTYTTSSSSWVDCGWTRNKPNESSTIQITNTKSVQDSEGYYSLFSYRYMTTKGNWNFRNYQMDPSTEAGLSNGYRYYLSATCWESEFNGLKVVPYYTGVYLYPSDGTTRWGGNESNPQQDAYVYGDNLYFVKSHTPASYHTEYYYREKVTNYTTQYIKYYYRNTECTSTTEITPAENISNIKKWVKYREK